MKARHLDIGLIIIILLITVPSAIIGARESGILYPWFVGRCFIGAYYDSTSFNDPVKGVRVKITDFYGRSQEVMTSETTVHVRLHFNGWYRIDATYNNSTKTTVIVTPKAYFTDVGYIYLILDEDTETVIEIKFVPPGPY